MSFDPNRPIQVLSDGKWLDAKLIGVASKSCPNWPFFVEYDIGEGWDWDSVHGDLIRNTPEPEWVPFTAETFPQLGRVEVFRKGINDVRLAVVYASRRGVAVLYETAGTASIENVEYARAMDLYEIRIDGGPVQPFGLRKS